MCKAHLRAQKCQLSQVMVSNMIIKMNIEHGLSYDVTNRRVV